MTPIIKTSLTPITSVILPSDKVTQRINDYNNHMVTVIPTTAMTNSAINRNPKMDLRNGKTPYKNNVSDATHLHLLGCKPTYRTIPGRVLKPLATTPTNRDLALEQFNNLPVLDKFFLLNISTYCPEALATSGEYLNTRSINARHKTLLNLEAVQTAVTNSRNTLHRRASILCNNSSKYIVNYENYPCMANGTANKYPHTSTIKGIEEYLDVTTLSHRYYNFFYNCYTNEETSLLGMMSTIVSNDGSRTRINDRTSTETDESRVLLSSSAAASPLNQAFDDSISSASIILPTYDYTTGASREVDLSRAYAYIRNVEYIVKSIHSLITEIYAATLPEARESNGEATTLLDFWGKHNLFDRRAALYLHRIKEERRKNNNITAWYNLCITNMYLDTKLRESGVLDGFGGLMSYKNIRDLMLFLLPGVQTDVEFFLDAVERGDGGDTILDVMSVNNTQVSPGMDNTHSYRRGSIWGDTPAANNLHEIKITTAFSPEFFAADKNYQQTHRPFSVTDGVELAANYLILINRTFCSSMILKRHDTPFLKSLYSLFMQQAYKYSEKNLLPGLSEFDHVAYLSESFDTFEEYGSALGDARTYMNLLDNDEGHAAFLTLPSILRGLFTPLLYPTLENDEIAWENTAIKVIPGNNVILGINTQEDILKNYDFLHDAIPNIWPPHQYQNLRCYSSNTYSDVSDIYSSFMFINSYNAKPGRYNLGASSYGMPFSTPEAAICRDTHFATIASHTESPSTPIRNRSNLSVFAEDVTPITVNITTGNNTRIEEVWEDRGVNIISALTYTGSLFIPPQLAYEAVNPSLVRDDDTLMTSRMHICKEVEDRIHMNYSGYLGLFDDYRLDFNVNTDTTKSSVSILSSTVYKLCKDILNIADGMGGVAKVLTDYLYWRTEALPSDTRFLNRVTKLRDLCVKYSHDEITHSICEHIVSQALNGSNINILKEV